MKKFLLLAVVACFVSVPVLRAQTEAEKNQEKPEGYVITPISEVKTTSVKDQNRSGTCWSFSGIGFLESELLRLGKPEVDLAPMFIVRMAYSDKAEKYVRMHGALNFAGGGAFYDVAAMIKKYGIVPMEVYQGLNYGEDNHVHNEMDRVLKAYVEAVVKNPNRKLSTAWFKGFNAVLDAYLGPIPSDFVYKGQKYSPKSYAESLGLNLDDYVYITSYTHHPFHSKFIMEVPDNWALAEVYNVPLDEFEAIFDNALDNGFPVAWASDVSEDGFSWTDGVAIVPDMKSEEITGSDMARWTKLTKRERMTKIFEKPGPELKITQEMRQEGFDRFETTDDHGMVLVGKAKDQLGHIYYKVKNSWGIGGKYDGYFYASKPFVLYKTMSIMVHKDAIPKNIRKKLNL